jgi:hypothetical protein
VDSSERARAARIWAAVWRMQHRVQGGDRSTILQLRRYAARLRELTGEDVHMEDLFNMLLHGPEPEAPQVPTIAAQSAHPQGNGKGKARAALQLYRVP